LCIADVARTGIKVIEWRQAGAGRVTAIRRIVEIVDIDATTNGERTDVSGAVVSITAIGIRLTTAATRTGSRVRALIILADWWALRAWVKKGRSS